MWGTSRRPDVREQIQKDPISFVDRLHDDYRACGKAYREDIHHLMQKCAFLTVAFQDGRTFKRLSRHPYWEKKRQKPKHNGRAKWAVYLMTQPESNKKRKVVGKYARVIDALLAEGVAPDSVAATIKERHGIPAILRERKREKLARSASQTDKDDYRNPGDGSNDKKSNDDQKKDRKGQANPTSGSDASPEIDSRREPEERKDTLSRNLHDTLFVGATPDQMAIAFAEGMINIRAKVSLIPGTERWIIKAMGVEREPAS